MVKYVIIVSSVMLLIFILFVLSSKKSDEFFVEVIFPLGITIRLKRGSLRGNKGHDAVYDKKK